MMDFSPLNQPSPKTLIKLLLGQNVSAEIRLRKLSNIHLLRNEDAIVKEWSKMNHGLTSEESELLTKKTIHSILDKNLKLFIQKICVDNQKQMNLYTYNCQHFCTPFTDKTSRDLQLQR